MPLSKLVRELAHRCDAIDAAWQREDRELATFAAIVASATADLDLTPFGRIGATAALVDEPEIAILQQASSFSDLYLRLYDNGHFWVEILHWCQSDINVHDHDFAGVQFQLAGESLNIQYSFETEACAAGIQFGMLRTVSTARWRPGDRSPVVAGRLAPHNVCHLDDPTVSLLIRTHPQPGLGPQWNYFAPGIAASYDVADLCFRKRVKALRLLARHGGSEEFAGAFRHYAAGLDLRQLLFVLLKMIDILFTPTRVHLLHELLDSGRSHIATVVESVSRHRAAEILKACRWSPALSVGEREAFALLGSCFDLDTAEALATGLIALAPGTTLADMLDDGCRHLQQHDAQQVANCLRLFGATPAGG
jgi:hypothetical protein